jgi:hypothetical protein
MSAVCYLVVLKSNIDSVQVLFGTGDVLAQQVVEKKGFNKHELARTGRMALYGGCETDEISLTGLS